MGGKFLIPRHLTWRHKKHHNRSTRIDSSDCQKRIVINPNSYIKFNVNVMFVWLVHFFFCQLILLFNLFLLLFMGFTTLFSTIYGSTVLFQLTFTFIYSNFSKKNFNFNKINKSPHNYNYYQHFSDESHGQFT